jgi:hypothetical protein
LRPSDVQDGIEGPFVFRVILIDGVCPEGGRMKLRPEWSERLLRKGVLVHETYKLFAAWDDTLS